MVENMTPDGTFITLHFIQNLRMDPISTIVNITIGWEGL
jgi:hypothetical protein